MHVQTPRSTTAPAGSSRTSPPARPPRPGRPTPPTAATTRPRDCAADRPACGGTAADHVHRRPGPDHGDLPVPLRHPGRPGRPGRGLRQDQLHLHPGPGARHDHRRRRQRPVLQLRPDREQTIAGRPRTPAPRRAPTTPAGQLLTSTYARTARQTSYVYDKDGRKTAEYDTTHGAAESSSDEIASWTYDTLAKGDLTSASSYYGGQAYTEAICGYNAFGEPTETYTTIPPAQGKLAGNYVTVDTYTAAGQLASYEDSPAGGLPQRPSATATTPPPSPSPRPAPGRTSRPCPTTRTACRRSTRWARIRARLHRRHLRPADPAADRAADVRRRHPAGHRRPALQLQQRRQHPGGERHPGQRPGAGPVLPVRLPRPPPQAWSQGTDCTTSSTPSTTAESGAEAPYWDSYTYNAIGNLTAATSTAASGTPTTTTEHAIRRPAPPSRTRPPPSRSSGAGQRAARPIPTTPPGSSPARPDRPRRL